MSNNGNKRNSLSASVKGSYAPQPIGMINPGPSNLLQKRWIKAHVSAAQGQRS